MPEKEEFFGCIARFFICYFLAKRGWLPGEIIFAKGVMKVSLSRLSALRRPWQPKKMRLDHQNKMFCCIFGFDIKSQFFINPLLAKFLYKYWLMTVKVQLMNIYSIVLLNTDEASKQAYFCRHFMLYGYNTSKPTKLSTTGNKWLCYERLFQCSVHLLCRLMPAQ